MSDNVPIPPGTAILTQKLCPRCHDENIIYSLISVEKSKIALYWAGLLVFVLIALIYLFALSDPENSMPSFTFIILALIGAFSYAILLSKARKYDKIQAVCRKCGKKWDAGQIKK